VAAGHADDISAGRVLAGRDHWWFLGPGGVARLGAHQVTAEGKLRPAAKQRLRDLGMCTSAPPRYYSLTVLTSTACNLGCGYCFQNTGQDPAGGNRPPRITSARLTSATITSILEFAARQMAKAGLEKLDVLLFGGEPLLNPRGCQDLLTRAADYGLASAGMISNSTLLTVPLATSLSDRGLRWVQVTFDGDRPEHDQIRTRRSHGGTFDGIVRNIARATEATALNWSLRVNVSHRNYAGINSLVERLAAALDTSRCTIYFTRVGDIGIGYANDLLHTGELSARFSRWHRRALELGFRVSLPHGEVKCLTCGYGDGRYGAVVNADGTLSSCWETAGKPNWEVGTVAEGYLPDADIRGRWTSCESGYRYADDAGTMAGFQDAVDAALLDYLSETGRLPARQLRPAK
jgi:uncharacterized protein